MSGQDMIYSAILNFAGDDLNAKTLQSPDDPDATFRNKGGEHHVGYVANSTKTCDPKNPLQLIVDVRTAPNVTDDSTLLAAGLPTANATLRAHVRKRLRWWRCHIQGWAAGE